MSETKQLNQDQFWQSDMKTLRYHVTHRQTIWNGITQDQHVVATKYQNKMNAEGGNIAPLPGLPRGVDELWSGPNPTANEKTRIKLVEDRLLAGSRSIYNVYVLYDFLLSDSK